MIITIITNYHYYHYYKSLYLLSWSKLGYYLSTITTIITTITIYYIRLPLLFANDGLGYDSKSAQERTRSPAAAPAAPVPQGVEAEQWFAARIQAENSWRKRLLKQ